MYLQKGISRKTYSEIYFCWYLEGRKRKEQYSDANPDL
jgi:hypothetical protein